MIQTVIKVFDDIFSYIDITHKFMSEVPESSLNSTDEVNALIGISGDMEGNMIFGFNKKTAFAIAQKIIGVNDITNIDLYAKAAISDFFSDFAKRFANEVRIKKMYELKITDFILLPSNPTYVAGSNMMGIISKVNSKKLFFKVNGEKFNIAYSLE